MSEIKRIGLSIVFSMISVLLLVLFIDEVLAVNTTPVNIVGSILLFSLFAVCIWKAKLILDEKVPEFLFEKNIAKINIFPVDLSAHKIRLKSEKSEKSEDSDAKEKKSKKEKKDDDL